MRGYLKTIQKNGWLKMGFFKTIFQKRNKKDQNAAKKERLLEDEVYIVPLEQVDIQDDKEREKYVISLLEQIGDASSQAKTCQDEYRIVDKYLKDMEELEYLKTEDRKRLLELASSISHLETDKSSYEAKGQHLSEELFEKAQRLESDADEGMQKLREAEEYQRAIHSDMQKLESEKQACILRRQDAEIQITNLQGMVQISTIGVAICFLVLLVMQFGFEMDTRIGYILIAAVYAAAIAFMYVFYLDASKESARQTRNLNKVILLQNRVKIRYVNNTNLLDYLYIKYDIKSAKELESLFTQYNAEKDERIRMIEAVKELESEQRELVDLLRQYNLFDPVIWVHQTQALLNPKEMVEVRHALILRRQKLRKQIDFNTKNSDDAKDKIKELVAVYPQYAKEVLKMVSDYEDEYPIV